MDVNGLWHWADFNEQDQLQEYILELANWDSPYVPKIVAVMDLEGNDVAQNNMIYFYARFYEAWVDRLIEGPGVNDPIYRVEMVNASAA